MQTFFIRLGELRNALKLARRSVSRNLTQSLLIVLIMAIPVAAVSFGQVYQASRIATPDEGIRISLGKTAAMFVSQDLPSPCLTQDPRAAITADGPYLIMQTTDGDDSNEAYLACVEAQDGKDFVQPTTLGLPGEWIVEERTSAYVTLDRRLIPVELVIGEAWHPALEGRYHSMQGEVPQRPDQILVSTPTLQRLGVKVGDSIRMDAGARPLEIVGTLESNNDPDDQGLVFTTADFLSIAPEYQVDGPYLKKYFLNSENPVTWNQVLEFNTLGLAVLSREVAANPPADSEVPLYQGRPSWVDNSEGLAGIFGTVWLFIALLFPVGALSGSAFAFGVRRQARNLAVIASLGASSRMLKLVNIMSGVWLGLLGSFAGVAIGVGGASWWLATQFDGSAWSYPGFHVPWDQLLVAMIFGVAFGVIFSIVPAVRASKVDIQTQLRGTRAEGNPRVSGGILSLLMIVIGGVLLSVGGVLSEAMRSLSPADPARQLLPLAIFGGGMLAALGLMTGSVWVLKSLHALFGRIPGAISYSLRDLIFNNKRFVPVISSILAVVFLGSSVGVLTFHFAKQSETYQQKVMESNQVMVDVVNTIPSLRNSWWGLSRQDVSDRIEAAAPILESTVSNLLDSGAEGAAVLKGQSRPGYAEMPTAEPGEDTWFGRIKMPAELICPYDERNPDFADYMAAQEAQDFEAIAQLDEKWAGCGTNYEPSWALVLVGEEHDLMVASAGTASPEAIQALAAGKIVAFADEWVIDDQVTLEFIDPAATAGQTPARIESAAAFLEPVAGNRYSVMMSPSTATELGLFYEPVSISAYFDRTVTEADLEGLRYLLGDQVEYDYSATFWNAENIAWIFSAVMAGLVLTIALIAIGLAQIESRADRGALWSVGASRWYRSRVVALQGFLLALIGVGLGLLIGAVTATAMVQMFSLGESITINIPATQLVAVLIAVPLLVGIVSALFGSGKLTRKRSALD